MIALIAALAVSTPPQQAPAARPAFFYTGRQLKDVCGKDDDLSLGLCVGYIDSVLDRLLFADTYIKPRRICLPQNTSNEVMRAAVMKQLAGPADVLRLPAFTYVQKAAAAGWSCPTEASTG